MTDANQLYVFFVCTLCGVCSGVIYDFIYCVRYPFRRGWVRVATDILFFVLFAGMYLFVTVIFSLPTVRFYMFGGCLVGFFLYLKSFHKIVAFFTEKLYNGIQRRKRAKDERTWPKKRNACPRGRRRELQ